MNEISGAVAYHITIRADKRFGMQIATYNLITPPDAAKIERLAKIWNVRRKPTIRFKIRKLLLELQSTILQICSVR